MVCRSLSFGLKSSVNMSKKQVSEKELPAKTQGRDSCDDSFNSESEISDVDDENAVETADDVPTNSDEDVSDNSGSSSGDDNAAGEDWMDVCDDESDTTSSSSSDKVTNEVGQESPPDVKSGDPKLHNNAGWADVMSKILRTSKPKGKRTVVLAKAKKLNQIDASKSSQETEKDYGFEIDGEEDDTDIKPKIEELDIKPKVTPMKIKSRRRDHLADGKVKPSIHHRERERALSKIATKGVVQLFNAVREQQKDISNKMKDAKGSVRKEEKILKSIDKRAFLDVLMGNAHSERVEDNVRTKAEKDVKTEKSDNPATWNVLRENFLTGSNLKDWDKCGEIKLEDDIEEVELS